MGYAPLQLHRCDWEISLALHVIALVKSLLDLQNRTLWYSLSRRNEDKFLTMLLPFWIRLWAEPFLHYDYRNWMQGSVLLDFQPDLLPYGVLEGRGYATYDAYSGLDLCWLDSKREFHTNQSSAPESESMIVSLSCFSLARIRSPSLEWHDSTTWSCNPFCCSNSTSHRTNSPSFIPTEDLMPTFELWSKERSSSSWVCCLYICVAKRRWWEVDIFFPVSYNFD